MTVFRVDVDRDEAEIVKPDPSSILTVRIDRNKNGHAKSLSEISMQQFGTFHLWPLIWMYNYSRLKDPNKTRLGMLLFVPRRHAVTPSQLSESTRIFLMWKDVSRARRMLKDWVERAFADGEPVPDDALELLPDWMRWNSDREPEWMKWNSHTAE
ncbi:hypothetical protein [Prosthecomicrobium sp. N25]|uniref:hypothetical protein n=1 Tax=Prosthecomicrobium sp. N25 TaxID=3129254 RepID=UPI0030774B4A